ncbi:hypothetical protein L210DRAFT_3649355 [Boletus edulis BED1]|uniref:Nitrogen regulatory protein areA GATA-like domain-containing protein n=1 Tax=Boletus edulis BED1 TaxID=1328754 RepID=A0AAD4GAJ9_BOLED|nr:hypothetical protein L210DRAFT_3649355 [Boletus edulis BED1]
MLATFPVPILSVTTEAVRDLQGQDALYGLWTVFTKCKESVQDGRRLENISWRLWYRELIQAQVSYHPSTPESTTPHPKDERFRSSYFPANANEKVSPELQVLSSGLPSPSDPASPSPLPPSMPTMVPPSTPERPRISPHSPGSTIPLSSFTRGKSTPCVGRLIVDMLPNHLFIPQYKSSHATTAKLVTPPPTVQPFRSCDLNVPHVQLPTTAETPFPYVVVVNPTPHPTPPTTPILHDDTPGAPRPLSTFLLPPLPPPALRMTVPPMEVHAQQQSQPPHSLIPKQSALSDMPTRVADGGSLARQPDRRFFLQQSPEDASSERGDGSTASGKSPSDLFGASSATSSEMKSVLTDVDDDNKDDLEEEEQGEEDDRRSTTAAAGTGARHPAHGHQNKPKRGKEVGKRPLMKRSHSAKHVAPSMVRKPSAQQQHHVQPERTEKKGAMFNIGSGSSNGSRSANGSTHKSHAKTSMVNGFTAIEPSKISPTKAQPPVIPKGFSGQVTAGTAGNIALNGNANVNGNVKANATGNVNGNAHSRKTVVVANSSEEYETTDGEDSEEWASEEMNADDKAREAEETRLREAALEAQRQRELFAKVPKRSYSNLNRTQSGLLSQLMNPDPSIFPPNHPYRICWSSADISRQYQHPQYHAPVPQRSSSAYAPPRLSTIRNPRLRLAMKRQESEKNGYRPKGPPKEQEMEDDSGDDADDKIQMSQSVAQQKLQALLSRRSLDRGTSHLIQPLAMEGGPGMLSSTSAPIPLGHPYNLPAAAVPMTPRTTRRRMLKTELSESMRRQLLWERQVSSNNNPGLVARRATPGMGGLRPLTSNSSDGIRDTTRTTEAQDKDERRRRAMARNRSWADDYHYSGW